MHGLTVDDPTERAEAAIDQLEATRLRLYAPAAGGRSLLNGRESA